MRDTRFSTLSTFLFLGVNIQKIKKSIMVALMKIGFRSICRENIHKEGFRLLISLTFAEDVKSDVWKIQIFLTREPIMASLKREIERVAKFVGLVYTVLCSIHTLKLFHHVNISRIAKCLHRAYFDTVPAGLYIYIYIIP